MQKWIQQQLPWKKSMKRYYSFSSQSIKSVMIVILLFQKYFIQYTWILNGIRQQAQPILAFSLHEGQNEYLIMIVNMHLIIYIFKILCTK